MSLSVAWGARAVRNWRKRASCSGEAKGSPWMLSDFRSLHSLAVAMAVFEGETVDVGGDNTKLRGRGTDFFSHKAYNNKLLISYEFV